MKNQTFGKFKNLYYSSVSFFLTPGIRIPNPAKIAATSAVKMPLNEAVPVFGNSDAV